MGCHTSWDQARPSTADSKVETGDPTRWGRVGMSRASSGSPALAALSKSCYYDFNILVERLERLMAFVRIVQSFHTCYVVTLIVLLSH